jgi:hypothetical protein
VIGWLHVSLGIVPWVFVVRRFWVLNLVDCGETVESLVSALAVALEEWLVHVPFDLFEHEYFLFVLIFGVRWIWLGKVTSNAGPWPPPNPLSGLVFLERATRCLEIF